MAKNNLRRVPIVDRNGKRTTVLKKDISDAFDRGETDLERNRRKKLLDTPFPHQVSAKDAAQEAVLKLFNGLHNSDPAAIVAGAIAFTTASIYGMRELRNVGWEGNKDLSRHFLARVADIDVMEPIEGFKKALKPAEIHRGDLGLRELAVLSAQHDLIEADARRARSHGNDKAAKFFEKTNDRLVRLVLEDDPATVAEAIAKELREQKFSDRNGWELLRTGWIPYGITRYTRDTRKYRLAHKKAALRMEQTAAALRSKKWP
jgi:hypothetical protein